MFIEQLFEQPFFYFSWVLVVMFSVSLHEYAHARAAYGAGDHTAWFLGHCSLNPWVQMGPISLIMLALFGVAWGAVPISRAELRDAKARAWMALAGPAANALLLFVFAGLSGVISTWWPHAERGAFAQFMQVGAAANAVLLILNMLPVPVLDGWEVLALFVPRVREISVTRAQQISWLVILVIFISPLGNLVWWAAATLHRLAANLWLRAFALFLA